jgi:transposase
MNAARVGLDLAKSVFQVHGVDVAGQAVVRRRLARSQLLGFFAKLPPCVIGMEACSSAHHWARELIRLGHEVRLIPPQYVKPYVKRNKTDAADAEAICEAVGRPNMRFVPIKTEAQQAVLALHRIVRPFVRQPIRENHQDLRSMNRAARPDTRQQALVSLIAAPPSTVLCRPARVMVLSAVSTSCRNIWSGPEARALQGPQRAYV